MIVNNNWYNLQSLRTYPLADSSTGVDDNGNAIKTNFLVDCHLMFPESYGKMAFIGSMSSTENLVSITFLISSRFTADILDNGEPVFTSESLSSSSSSDMSGSSSSSESAEPTEFPFIPLGVITLQKPINYFVNYPITPFLDGVGGFVVFGEGTNEVTNLKFSTPEQSALLLRCASSYPDSPVTSLSKVNLANELDGIVQLTGTNNITVEKETVDVEGKNKQAFVISLTDTSVNNFALFTDPCGRPESGTCNPPGIKSINGVTPDCNGNIDIIFEGFTETDYIGCTTSDSYSYAGTHGIGLGVDLGIEGVCDNIDTTRFEYVDGKDYCEVIDSISSSSSSSSIELADPLSYGSSPTFPVALNSGAQLSLYLRSGYVEDSSPATVLVSTGLDIAMMTAEGFKTGIYYPGLGSTNNCWTSNSLSVKVIFTSTYITRDDEAAGLISNYVMPTYPGYSEETYLFFAISPLKSSFNIYTCSHEREPRLLQSVYLGKTILPDTEYSIAAVTADDEYNSGRIKATISVTEVGGASLITNQTFYNLPGSLCGNAGVGGLRCTPTFKHFSWDKS